MGALDGIRIVEFAGIGPGPMAAMLLAQTADEALLEWGFSPAQAEVFRDTSALVKRDAIGATPSQPGRNT